MLWSPPLPYRVTKDTAEVGAPGAWTPPHSLTCEKTGSQKGADSPQVTQSASIGTQGPGYPAKVSLLGPELTLTLFFLSLKKTHF